MPVGPGRYDNECMQALHSTKAEGVLLVVINGDRGHGFSLTTSSPEIVAGLPHLLRSVAEEIEATNNDANKG